MNKIQTNARYIQVKGNSAELIKFIVNIQLSYLSNKCLSTETLTHSQLEMSFLPCVAWDCLIHFINIVEKSIVLGIIPHFVCISVQDLTCTILIAFVAAESRFSFTTVGCCPGVLTQEMLCFFHFLLLCQLTQLNHMMPAERRIM